MKFIIDFDAILSFIHRILGIWSGPLPVDPSTPIPAVPSIPAR